MLPQRKERAKKTKNVAFGRASGVEDKIGFRSSQAQNVRSLQDPCAVAHATATLRQIAFVRAQTARGVDASHFGLARERAPPEALRW